MPHEEKHEEKKETGSKTNGEADKFFGKIADYFSEKITAFVVFLFLLFGAGMLYGRYVVMNSIVPEIYLLALPFLVAAIAYYNRFFAVIVFVLFILFLLL